MSQVQGHDREEPALWVVITADQRQSRRGRDLVPTALGRLEGLPRPDAGRAFERTAGDEIQGILGDPTEVAETLRILLDDATWSVGIGIGAGRAPAPSRHP